MAWPYCAEVPFSAVDWEPVPKSYQTLFGANNSILPHLRRFAPPELPRVQPVLRLNVFSKWLRSPNPAYSDISVTLSQGFSRSSCLTLTERAAEDKRME